MVKFIGHKIVDHGPHCTKCMERAVRFPGATCSMCRTEARDRRALGLIVLIVLCAGLLIMGLATAYGQFMNKGGVL